MTKIPLLWNAAGLLAAAFVLPLLAGIIGYFAFKPQSQHSGDQAPSKQADADARRTQADQVAESQEDLEGVPPEEELRNGEPWPDFKLS